MLPLPSFFRENQGQNLWFSLFLVIFADSIASFVEEIQSFYYTQCTKTYHKIYLFIQKINKLLISIYLYVKIKTNKKIIYEIRLYVQ